MLGIILGTACVVIIHLFLSICSNESEWWLRLSCLQLILCSEQRRLGLEQHCCGHEAYFTLKLYHPYIFLLRIKPPTRPQLTSFAWCFSTFLSDKIITDVWPGYKSSCTVSLLNKDNASRRILLFTSNYCVLGLLAFNWAPNEHLWEETFI